MRTLDQRSTNSHLGTLTAITLPERPPGGEIIYTMKTLIFAVSVFSLAVLGCASVAGTRDAPKMALDAHPMCVSHEGYVVAFRMANADSRPIEVPESLLPWSPSAHSIQWKLVSKSGAVIPEMGLMAESWGSVSLPAGSKLVGEIPLSLIYSSDDLTELLTAGDATLFWTFNLAIDGRAPLRTSGEIKLLGGAYYERCRSGHGDAPESEAD